MAQKQVFIQPKDIYTNIPGNFALGRKSSGVAMLQYPTTGAGIGANTNLVIGFGVPWEIWNGDDNRSMYLKSVKLNHFIAAVAAGVTPISSGNVAFYEVVHSNGIVYAGLSSSPASAAMAQLQDATASAGYITTASAQGQGQALSAAGVAIASLWTSSQYETVFTNDAVDDLVERDVPADDRRHPSRDGRDEVVELDALQVHGTVIVTVPHLPRNAEPDDQVRVCPNTRPSGRVLQHGDPGRLPPQGEVPRDVGVDVLRLDEDLLLRHASSAALERGPRAPQQSALRVRRGTQVQGQHGDLPTQCGTLPQGVLSATRAQRLHDDLRIRQVTATAASDLDDAVCVSAEAQTLSVRGRPATRRLGRGEQVCGLVDAEPHQVPQEPVDHRVLVQFRLLGGIVPAARRRIRHEVIRGLGADEVGEAGSTVEQARHVLLGQEGPDPPQELGLPRGVGRDAGLTRDDGGRGRPQLVADELVDGQAGRILEFLGHPVQVQQGHVGEVRLGDPVTVLLHGAGDDLGRRVALRRGRALSQGCSLGPELDGPVEHDGLALVPRDAADLPQAVELKVRVQPGQHPLLEVHGQQP